MTVAIVAVVAVVLVLVIGLLIFKLMKTAQSAVPAMADPSRPTGDRVVGTDEQGQAISEAEEPAEPARDTAAFDTILQDEIRDRGMRQPAADDEA